MRWSPIEKLWIGGTVVVALLLVVVGYFFFIGPQRAETSDVQGRIADAQLRNDVLQSRMVALSAQSKKLPEYRRALHAAQAALPSTSGLPDFLRSMQALGAETNTSVGALSIGAPTDLTPTSPTATTAPDPSAQGTTAPSGPHVYALSISAQVTGSITALREFLDQLQSVQPRAVLISAVTESAPTTGSPSAGASGQSSLSLTMKAFVAPTNVVEQQQLAQAAQP